MSIRIRDDQRGILFIHGNYKKTLAPGKYSFLPFGSRVEVMDIDKPFSPAGRNLNLFLKDEKLTSELEIIEVKDDELILHYEDGLFTGAVTPGRYAFWKVLKKHEFERIKIKEPEVPDKIDKSIFSRNLQAGVFSIHEVDGHEQGLLFYNGVFRRILLPGKYYFWTGPVSVKVIKADMRQLQLDMTGQEIMTSDKVSLRLNFVCHYKITDPVKALLEIKSFEEQIYILLQLILREYVGTLTLDELLRKKEEIGDFVLGRLREKSETFGINFVFAGVKDVVLPGEIKDILNMVLLAEKKAQATIITRREETASTRSLLNTAKLMDDNPTLYKLKEMEHIETICEKIGNLSVYGEGGILNSLRALLSPDKKEK